MNTDRLKRIASRVTSVVWVVFLVGLPITSFPFFPEALGGRTSVRPFALYPLAILLVLVVLPRLWGKSLPRTFLSFFPFILVAVFSSLLSLLQGLDALQGITALDRFLRTLITVGIGAGFYFAVTLYPRSIADLRAALRWLYAGLALSLLWGTLQAIYVINFTDAWYFFLDDLQGFISIRGLFESRISGPTYEPNWYADQIVLMYLPWLLGAVLRGYSVFRRRWRWVTVELGLLLWAMVILSFTFSKAGAGIGLVMIFLGVAVFRPVSGPSGGGRFAKLRRYWQRIGPLAQKLVMALILLAVLLGAVFVLGERNPYFARIWDPSISGIQVDSLESYIKALGVGARMLYMQTAFNIYEQHPFIGVGLGNYTFYIEENLPEIPLHHYPEVLRYITPKEGRSVSLTPKNFFVRILAETGLSGMATFAVFLIALTGCGLYLWLSPEGEAKYWGAAGLLGMLAFAMDAFSYDSFAFPNMWVVFGLVTAAARLFAAPALNSRLTTKTPRHKD